MITTNKLLKGDFQNDNFFNDNLAVKSDNLRNNLRNNHQTPLKLSETILYI